MVLYLQWIESIYNHQHNFIPLGTYLIRFLVVILMISGACCCVCCHCDSVIIILDDNSTSLSSSSAVVVVVVLVVGCLTISTSSLTFSSTTITSSCCCLVVFDCLIAHSLGSIRIQQIGTHREIETFWFPMVCKRNTTIQTTISPINKLVPSSYDDKKNISSSSWMILIEFIVAYYVGGAFLEGTKEW